MHYPVCAKRGCQSKVKWTAFVDDDGGNPIRHYCGTCWKTISEKNVGEVMTNRVEILPSGDDFHIVFTELTGTVTEYPGRTPKIRGHRLRRRGVNKRLLMEETADKTRFEGLERVRFEIAENSDGNYRALNVEITASHQEVKQELREARESGSIEEPADGNNSESEQPKRKTSKAAIASRFYEQREKDNTDDDDGGLNHPLTDGVIGSRNDLLN